MDKTTKKTSERNLFAEIFSLDSLSNRKLEVSFTAPDLSSQGGLLLYIFFHGQAHFVNIRIQGNRCSIFYYLT